jgi:hypothetical protein
MRFDSPHPDPLLYRTAYTQFVRGEGTRTKAPIFSTCIHTGIQPECSNPLIEIQVEFRATDDSTVCIAGNSRSMENLCRQFIAASPPTPFGWDLTCWRAAALLYSRRFFSAVERRLAERADI